MFSISIGMNQFQIENHFPLRQNYFLSHSNQNTKTKINSNKSIIINVWLIQKVFEPSIRLGENFKIILIDESCS